MRKPPNRFDTVVGLSVVAGLLSGGLGLLVAVIAAFDGNWVGTGVCLMAAALAFGLTTNALLRQ